MKKTVLSILLLCTLLLIRPATALASSPSCKYCGGTVTLVRFGTSSHAHEFIYECVACKRYTRLAGHHTGGKATCMEVAVCEVCKEPYGELAAHTGGTEFPTCTTGKTCALCGAEYGILGHDWGEWTPNGNGTHTRSCTRCPEVEPASCTGGTATCSAKAVCVACGGEYGEKDPNNHDLVQHAAKAPTCTDIGWDAYEACKNCNYTTRTELPALNHALVHHEAKAPTCTEIGWNAYDTCSRCNYNTCA